MGLGLLEQSNIVEVRLYGFQGLVTWDGITITSFAGSVTLRALRCHVRNPIVLKLPCLAPSQATWNNHMEKPPIGSPIADSSLQVFPTQAPAMWIKGLPDDPSPQPSNHPSPRIFPVEILDSEEQRQAILLCPVLTHRTHERNEIIIVSNEMWGSSLSSSSYQISQLNKHLENIYI